jgi:hypothetical protein
MMISGATAQTGPWPPFTGFMIVFYSTMWDYLLRYRPVLDTLRFSHQRHLVVTTRDSRSEAGKHE